MTKTKDELDIKNIDYDKLAVAIINEWDSDREESGRKELVKGMSYVLSKYQTEEWIYNINFHIDGCFAPVQLIFPKRVSITRAVQKARKVFENTTWCKQPYWND